MPPDDKMYKLICEKRFDEQKLQNQHIIDLLKGEDGNPGVVDKVRNNSKALKRLYGAFIFCGGAVVLQIIRGAYNWIESLLHH